MNSLRCCCAARLGRCIGWMGGSKKSPGGEAGAFCDLERGLFFVNFAFLIAGVEQLVRFVAERFSEVVLVDLGDHRVVV